MCTNECTIKLNDLSVNLNNEPLKKKCLTINDYFISTTNKNINNFYGSQSNEDIRTNTNEHIIQRHFFLKNIEDVNDA